MAAKLLLLSSLVGGESWAFWSGAEGAEGELAGHPACGRVGGVLQDPRPGERAFGTSPAQSARRGGERQQAESDRRQVRTRLGSSEGEVPFLLLTLRRAAAACVHDSGPGLAPPSPH